MAVQYVLSNQTAGAPPPRRPYSLRRTSSHQTYWPGGGAAPAVMAGRARDLYTRARADQVEVVDHAWIDARLNAKRQIVSLDGSQHRDILAGFAGLAPGGPIRKAMAAQIPQEGEANTLLHRLLDDMAGAAFMSPSAWYDWPGGVEGYSKESGELISFHWPVEGLCLSYTPGSEAMTPEGLNNEAIAEHPFFPPPFSDDDPWQWHEFVQTAGPNCWRLRRMDVFREDGRLVVDAWFQDSSVLPDRTDLRRIFHEYSLLATFDDDDELRLRSIEATPRVLPYRTCLAGPESAKALIGRSGLEFRKLVIELLSGTRGCTHLNDMLRALQDIGAVAAKLREVESRGSQVLASVAG